MRVSLSLQKISFHSKYAIPLSIPTIELLKYLYGLLKSELLFYKKLVKVLKDIGFKLNTYDPCVANIIVNDKQHTILCHVEDVKSYHVDPKKVMILYSG